MDILPQIIVLLALALSAHTLKPGDCEVCIKTIDKFSSTLSDATKKDPKKIEDEFKIFCKGTKNKENRLCYYLGGLEESATGILGELSKPLSWSMPAEKICEKLKKKDGQVCDLRYDVEIDLKTVDLKKLKVYDFYVQCNVHRFNKLWLQVETSMTEHWTFTTPEALDDDRSLFLEALYFIFRVVAFLTVCFLIVKFCNWSFVKRCMNRRCCNTYMPNSSTPTNETPTAPTLLINMPQNASDEPPSYDVSVQNEISDPPTYSQACKL
ncbi:hypothetical protein RN001_010502 [Aquatica leii]|uniref:Mesencephalic astrocyte-derived neurotrophic factor homolog n=1 Tax=Aquatica leii TaxID=1421715 RepID=A0AAN7S8L6_9COLE|nr:hypothetical protein RN001_010502 [Aquatica leii]